MVKLPNLQIHILYTTMLMKKYDGTKLNCSTGTGFTNKSYYYVKFYRIPSVHWSVIFAL